MIVYLHRSNVTGNVFYVGMGQSEKRAKQYGGRPDFWMKVAEQGYTIEIPFTGLSREDAARIEGEQKKKYASTIINSPKDRAGSGKIPIDDKDKNMPVTVYIKQEIIDTIGRMN